VKICSIKICDRLITGVHFKTAKVNDEIHVKRTKDTHCTQQMAVKLTCIYTSQYIVSTIIYLPHLTFLRCGRYSADFLRKLHDTIKEKCQGKLIWVHALFTIPPYDRAMSDARRLLSAVAELLVYSLLQNTRYCKWKQHLVKFIMYMLGEVWCG